MCVTYVSYLPTVVDEKVQQLKNTQMAGVSKWVKSETRYTEKGWQPSKAKFYGYLGVFEELWSPIKEGDQLQFMTTTSGSPAIDHIVWHQGGWRAWVTTGHCGIGHWTQLIEDAEKAESKIGAICDNGIFCKDAQGA